MQQTSSLSSTTLPTNTIQIGENFAYEGYYCGCGLLFEDQEMFKSHTLQKHRGPYVLHSSHYIHRINQKVMICQHWDPSIFSVASFTVVKAKSQAKIAQLQKDLRTFKDQLKTTNVNKPKRGIKFPIEDKLQSLSNCADLNESQLGEKQKTIDRLHFRVKEEPQTKRQQILRGRSCFEYERQDEVTCLSDMEQSTPTLCRSPKIQQRKELPFLKKEIVVKKQALQDSSHKILPLVQNSASLQTVKIFSGCWNVQVPMYMLGVFHFLRQQSIKASETQSITFDCGCGRQIKNPAKYGVALQHITKAHNRIVPSNSSHIFLRRCESICGLNLVSRLLSVNSSEDSPGWFCPCRPGVDMTQKQLIKHVIHVHKGISPIYVLPFFQLNQNKHHKK